jgi:hypothetical protein
LNSYLLAIKDLKDIYSGKYINEVLLETLKDFNIKYNIIRYIYIYLKKKRKIILIFNSITRDNAGLNDTLIEAFFKYYNK